jgi:hypothetical protein
MAMRVLLIGALAAFAASGAAANPRFDYLLYCGGCHLEDGSGDPPEVPDLRADLDRFVHLPDGRSYMARVPGSFQAPISDAALAELLNWMVATYTPEVGDFEPFTAQEVAAYRAEPLLDPLTFRARIVRDLEADAAGGNGS